MVRIVLFKLETNQDCRRNTQDNVEAPDTSENLFGTIEKNCCGQCLILLKLFFVISSSDLLEKVGGEGNGNATVSKQLLKYDCAGSYEIRGDI